MSRIDMTRGSGIYQRFICRRREQINKNCTVLPISSSSLVAGVVAGRNISLYGLSDIVAVDSEKVQAESTKVSSLAERVNATVVEEALDLGHFVLLAGAATTEREATVQLAREVVVFDWRAYTITVVATFAICILLLLIEFFARTRLRTFSLGADAPLDPVHMAQVCGAPMPEGNPVKKMRTPLKELGYGVRIVWPQGRDALCDSYWEVGPRKKDDENLDAKRHGAEKLSWKS